MTGGRFKLMALAEVPEMTLYRWWKHCGPCWLKAAAQPYGQVKVLPRPGEVNIIYIRNKSAPMEARFTVVSKEKDTIVLEMVNYDNTLLRPLMEELLHDENVEESRYYIKHPPHR